MNNQLRDCCPFTRTVIVEERIKHCKYIEYWHLPMTIAHINTRHGHTHTCAQTDCIMWCSSRGITRCGRAVPWHHHSGAVVIIYSRPCLNGDLTGITSNSQGRCLVLLNKTTQDVWHPSLKMMPHHSTGKPFSSPSSDLQIKIKRKIQKLQLLNE